MRSRIPIIATATAATTVAMAVAHGVPILTSVRAFRIRCTPALSGVGRAGHVALTFDDGPDPSSTPIIMDALDRLGWKATFFLLGENARKAPGLTKELVAAGHEVGVHGERHDSHFTRTFWDSVADIRLGRDTVADIADVRPEWFRPAYGSLSTGAVCWRPDGSTSAPCSGRRGVGTGQPRPPRGR